MNRQEGECVLPGASAPSAREECLLSTSIVYRVCEPFPDARSALSRARAIMRELADWKGVPRRELKLVDTAEQYAHVMCTLGAAMAAWDRDLPGFGPVRDELRRRGVASDWEVWGRTFIAHVKLRPDLADLWPLPEGLALFLSETPPFGGPDSEPEDDCTEEEVDRMVAVLGPLAMDVRWDCGWRGLPTYKGCGVTLCLNTVQVEQCTEPAPGEFGVWVSLGSRLAWSPAGQAWLRDSGLTLGRPQTD